MKGETQQIKKAILLVGNALYETAELMKAFIMLSHVPVAFQDDVEIKRLLRRVTRRLDTLSYYQKHHKPLMGFSDPPDVRNKTAYVYLKKQLDSLPNIQYVVDIGCYTGWLGRYLGSAGYRVHGIDIDVTILKIAQYLASGLHLVTYEQLTVEELGIKHPHTYDAAIAFDVIEHLFDTELGIKSIEQSVVSDGFIFINLPMIESPDTLTFRSTKVSSDIHKEHIHVFPKKKVNELFSHKKNVSIEIVKGENDCNNWFISYQKDT